MTGIPPPIISAPRFVTLFASLLVTLASGTNYVRPYAPQLGTRLRISHTMLNVIALAGNVGVYSTGPAWGRIVDTKGPKPNLAAGFIFLLIGYSGIKYYYDTGLPDGTSLTGFSYFNIGLFAVLTGAGGNAGMCSAMSAVARSFPDRMRASTTGLVMSGFGLSAFLFSVTAHVAFPGDTSAFLLLLATGTSIPMIIGYFFVRSIPLPASEDSGEVDHPAIPHMLTVLGGPNLHGLQVLLHPNFALICTILAILTGTGLMYINNVGSMSHALYVKEVPIYNDATATKWQATQVSTISVMNCLGRIIIGIISDLVKNRTPFPRSSLLVPISLCFLFSQLLAAHTDAVEGLWKSSAALGLAYGSAFALLPSIVIEWFGMPHFSENWGYISVSPMVGGNVFSLLFGWNLDRHSSAGTSGGVPSDQHGQCLDGRLCYVDALYITAGFCTAGMFLSAFAAWRDYCKMAPPQVVVEDWEEEN
ncbi:MFS general substrate transporter [Fistulina hepatica ATCC 64428]|uniref:MFS general substrate transporter n=1 Tax=Fistulina hepatica ATCC 64428 TaxID=1128425 RepID=A0A0D7AA47_9AGAR|nr:MFS general substrate transporter [Fistulina hepatica ATCC 64428]